MLKIKEFILKNKIMCGVVTFVLVVAVSTCVFLFAGSKKEEPKTLEALTTQEIITEKETVEETTETKKDNNLKEDEMYSYLTGVPVKKTLGNKRPIAFMINNIIGAIPQSGIEGADVIYEATVEGGITRLMAIFQDITKIQKVGSVRSCRFYYAYWATEWDAFYAHWGQSGYAMDFLESGKVDTLNSNDNTALTTYYIDSNVQAPHNVFATPSGVKETIKTKGYKTNHNKNYNGTLKFMEYKKENTLKEGKTANKIELNYPVNFSYFVYDKKTKKYSRFQYDGKHIDALTNNQLTCDNVIVEKADAPLFNDNKSVDFQILGNGKGCYFTRGKYIDITWEKDKDTSVTHYYDKSGKELKLNTGKTWICVMPSSQELTLSK